ncbi:MAG: dihydrofolate reductase, partial [Paludibacter sp.]
MISNRKVILYIAMSLDGYIAKPNDDLSFLSMVQQEGEDYGYTDFVNTVDTVIMGRKTYDWVMTQVPEFPHNDKAT